MKTLIIITALALTGCGIKQESDRAGLPIIDKCFQNEIHRKCLATVTKTDIDKYHYNSKNTIGGFCAKKSYEMAFYKSLTETPSKSCSGSGR